MFHLEPQIHSTWASSARFLLNWSLWAEQSVKEANCWCEMIQNVGLKEQTPPHPPNSRSQHSKEQGLRWRDPVLLTCRLNLPPCGQVAELRSPTSAQRQRWLDVLWAAIMDPPGPHSLVHHLNGN